MSKKTVTLTTTLSIIAIVLSLVTLAMALKGKPADKSPEESPDTQYVMYLGTNDKDTNQPVFPPEKAKEEAKKILIKHFGGYTIQEANGGWMDGDALYQEYTLVIYLSDTDLEHIHVAADEMIDTFRQSSVLIQANKTATEFYSGQ